MRKFYLQPLWFVVFLLLANSLSAQRKPSSVVTLIEGKRPVVINTNRGAASGCDTLKYAESQNWTPVLTTWGFNGGDGYVTGKNKFNDIQKGSFFDASSSQASYLIKTWIYFGAAGGSDLSNKRIPVNVYDYNSATGTPGDLLGTTDITLQDIKTDVQNKAYTQVQFDPAIRLSASKKFFITVDFSSLVWTNPAPATGNDTLAVYSNKSGESADNAIEQTGTGSWQKISSGWPGVGEMDLFIFPFVSTDISCGLLPLKLLQFNAERKGKDVVVNWTVANEYDMLNYEVERADDNLTFKKVASVNAVNATSYTYAVTDKNVTGGTSGKVTYRLKQINKDGSFTYSSYVVINIGEGFTITFENPVHNSLKLHVSSSAPQKIAVRMFDMQGKFVGIQQEALVDAGNQIINLNGSASLSPGVYILDVLINNEHKHYKVVKH